MQAAAIPSSRVTQAFAPQIDHVEDAPIDVERPVLHSKQYRIVEQLGEGGMGTVYRAYDPVLERDVALKVLKAGLPISARERFRHEARHGARLCHPNIVRVFDLGVMPEAGLDWFAMEYLEGRDLETLLARAARRSLRLPPRLVAMVFDRVLDALEHAHSLGLVHRDVKPANIFITRQPSQSNVGVKLLDFGVAVDRLREDEPLELCGDPRYVAPEQALGEQSLDRRADIYAAGISLYEALTGWHPFEDIITEGTARLIQAQCDEPVPQVSHRLPRHWPAEVRCGLDVIIDCACAKDPKRRFDSAASMREALRSVLGQPSPSMH